MNNQHLDEITIPDIEITAGWAVSEIETIEDCDDAYAYLMSAVAEIEYHLEAHALGVRDFPDPMWPARARRALKYKKTALQLVGWTRGRLNEDAKRERQDSSERKLMEHIKASVSSTQFDQWLIGSGAKAVMAEAA